MSISSNFLLFLPVSFAS